MLTRRELLQSTTAAVLSGGWTHGLIYDYIKNIVTDFGAPTDGTTDSSPAWLNFLTFLDGLSAGKTVLLIVPNHTYHFNRIGPGIDLVHGVTGGLTVVINAPTGATFFADTGEAGYFIGVRIGFEDFGTGFSYIQSANAGATSIFLVTPSEYTRFVVGRWLGITGLDLQGFGQPPNPAFFEYQKIVSVNSITGEITLASPLKNTYLSTWPLWNPDHGNGPATVYIMFPEWDCDVTYNNITFQHPSQVYTGIRILRMNNCIDNTVNGIVPTGSSQQYYTNCQVSNLSSGGVEVDKMVEELHYNTCTSNGLQFQNMNGGQLTTLTNCNITTVNGTPKNIIINGCTIANLGIAPLGNGYSKSVSINNSNITSFTNNSQTTVSTTGYSATGGVITAPTNGQVIPPAIPGAKCYFSIPGVLNADNYCTVTALGGDTTTAIITTDLPDALPTNANLMGLLPTQDNWVGTGNTGILAFNGYNLAAAQNNPLFSYCKRTYDQDTLVVPSTQFGTTFQMIGTLVAININVITPYTGAQSDMVISFIDLATSADKTTQSFYGLATRINCKVAGIRQITPTTVSGQPGDTGFDAPPGAIWLAGNQHNTLFAPAVSPSGENAGPVVEIEMITNV